MKNLFLLLTFLIFIGCSTDDEVNVTLAGHEKVLAYSPGEAKQAFALLGLNDIQKDLQYRFDVYEIKYNTSYGNRPVQASALVSIPKTDEAMPMLSFQHGTIVAHGEAPSETLSSHMPFFSLASAGYIMVIPDYIGFGNSTDLFHPYYVAEPMGKSVMDAIIAAKELVHSLEAQFDGNLFLAGYSEGGYATMAAHKYIEANSPRGDITLVASAPAAGGYDVKGMQEYFFNVDIYDQPFYMAYVALAYKNYYEWNEPLSTYFKEPYASKLEQLFNGHLTGGQINAQLTNSIADFLQEDMLENFDTSDKYVHLKEAFEENSLIHWEPVAPIFMYHGTEDVTVPYTNSITSHDALVKDAEDQERILLILLEGEDHSSGVLPYVKDLYNQLKALK